MHPVLYLDFNNKKHPILPTYIYWWRRHLKNRQPNKTSSIYIIMPHYRQSSHHQNTISHRFLLKRPNHRSCNHVLYQSLSPFNYTSCHFFNSCIQYVNYLLCLHNQTSIPPLIINENNPKLVNRIKRLTIGSIQVGIFISHNTPTTTFHIITISWHLKTTAILVTITGFYHLTRT